MIDQCGWPRCRRTDTDIIFYGIPLCPKHHGNINASDPDGERPLSQYGLEEAKRILGVSDTERKKE